MTEVSFVAQSGKRLRQRVKTRTACGKVRKAKRAQQRRSTR